ncbi:HET-domain-containing protein [Hypoxylon trugodes]|uniref:HET-domain-containing protein n=1 Tax=Hypoxylon trugodes TaxID=326681 RepID=UPI00219A4F75|nr:HET-domain-containing protein [Hypoxylon trugodes]KAI1394353.1 HET-domain-containing protein [Hypoxylon trugodes]
MNVMYHTPSRLMRKMPARCDYCAGLSISLLVDLAKQEFSGKIMPEKAFYQHHASLGDLEALANRGCGLCTLMLECFKGTPLDYTQAPTWRTKWTGSACKLEESMFFAANEYPFTDLKLAINSHHVYFLDTLDSVRVFDQILVQVGIIQNLDEATPDDDQHWGFDPLALTLTVPREEAVRVDDYHVGRFQTDPNLGSQQNFDIAKTWLEICQKRHANCLKGDAFELPTRVIDVGIGENAQSLRLIHSNGKTARYITLSHCWGGPVSPLLTTKTLSEFQHLPFHRLPANFRDAIIVARKFGIRYLWIDSLCILQDSKHDWEQESKKMATFYRNSTFTIYAEPPGPQPVKLNIYPNDQRHQVIVKRITHEREDLRTLDDKSPLTSRGWTLQESLLSPRHLYYGNRQIYWKCPNGFESADGLPPGNSTPEFNSGVLSSALFGDLLAESHKEPIDTMQLVSRYYDLVEQYSYRKLAFDSDKLPAFSGLAQRIHTVLPGQYIAGLWSCDFGRGLVWYEQTGSSGHGPSYRAPSWSWAVTNVPITYQGVPLNSDRFELKLLEHDLKYCDPSNPYGEVKSGHVVVQGYTISLVGSNQVVDETLEDRSTIRTYFDEPRLGDDVYVNSGAVVFQVHRGDSTCLLSVRMKVGGDTELRFDPTEFPPEGYPLLLIGTRTAPDDSLYAECLVLREVACRKGSEFERVGIMTIWELDPAWLEEWEERVLKLV